MLESLAAREHSPSRSRAADTALRALRLPGYRVAPTCAGREPPAAPARGEFQAKGAPRRCPVNVIFEDGISAKDGVEREESVLRDEQHGTLELLSRSWS